MCTTNYIPTEKTTSGNGKSARNPVLDSTRGKCYPHTTKCMDQKKKFDLKKRKLKVVLQEIFGKGSKYSECLRWAHEKTGGLQILKQGDYFKYSGRWRCKSRNCPICGVIRDRRNATKVEDILQHPDMEDTTVLFATLTKKKTKEAIADAYDLQSKMRSQLNRSLHNGKRFDLIGSITNVEMTYELSRHLVHNHSHVMYVFSNKGLLQRNPGKSLKEIVESIKAYIKSRWCSLAVKYGVEASPKAQDVQEISHGERRSAGQYLTKFALELSGDYDKDAKVGGSYTYGGLLNLYLATRRQDVARAIRRIAEGTKCKRTFQISKGLKHLVEDEEYENAEDVFLNVPIPVYGRLAKEGTQDILIDVYNGHYNDRYSTKTLDDIMIVFEVLCERFQHGEQELQDVVLLREFSKGLWGLIQDEEPPPDAGVTCWV